jgi:hypothetical protein
VLAPPRGARRRSIALLLVPSVSHFVPENFLSTFVVLFGTAALVATALLFVLQMFEDFRNA